MPHRARVGGGAGSWSVWRLDRSVHSGGAEVVASVAMTVRAGPLEDPRCEHQVVPAGVGLQPVVEPAQGTEVAARRRAGLRAALCLGVVVVFDDVVDVAAAGWSGAPGEHAGLVHSR